MDRKILIIDDEPDMRSLLKRALMSRNYFVEEAENLQQGMEIYLRMAPDIIMLDVNLPDGNGVDYVARFKNGKTTVLLMSADNDQLKDSFTTFGANGFLRKPFKFSELLTAINENQNA
jgi:DNA-binding response OmpR family regulator